METKFLKQPAAGRFIQPDIYTSPQGNVLPKQNRFFLTDKKAPPVISLRRAFGLMSRSRGIKPFAGAFLIGTLPLEVSGRDNPIGRNQ